MPDAQGAPQTNTSTGNVSISALATRAEAAFENCHALQTANTSIN